MAISLFISVTGHLVIAVFYNYLLLPILFPLSSENKSLLSLPL